MTNERDPVDDNLYLARSEADMARSWIGTAKWDKTLDSMEQAKRLLLSSVAFIDAAIAAAKEGKT